MNTQEGCTCEYSRTKQLRRQSCISSQKIKEYTCVCINAKYSSILVQHYTSIKLGDLQKKDSKKKTRSSRVKIDAAGAKICNAMVSLDPAFEFVVCKYKLSSLGEIPESLKSFL